MPNAKNPAAFNGGKGYSIKMLAGAKDVEINMYGEIVSSRPTDFWTGEPEPGLFICLDEFLADLDSLADADNITVYINSVGGEVYAALAIRNRLRALKAKVTTINDSLAASAGSVLLQAASNGCRKVRNASSTYVHRASQVLIGYYNATDLQKTIELLKSAENTAVTVYCEMSGRPEAEMRGYLEAETWLNAKQAVEDGFADEIIADGDGGIEMSMAQNRSYMCLHGVRMQATGMPTALPEGIDIIEDSASAGNKNESTPAAAPKDGNNDTGGNNSMSKFTTADELRADCPDLTAQIENAAKQSGVTEERARLQSIEEIEGAIGDAKMVQDAKYGDHPMTAAELALKVTKAQAKIGAKMLSDLDKDADDSNAKDVAPAPGEGDGKALTPQQRIAKGLADAKALKEKKEGK